VGPSLAPISFFFYILSGHRGYLMTGVESTPPYWWGHQIYLFFDFIGKKYGDCILSLLFYVSAYFLFQRLHPDVSGRITVLVRAAVGVHPTTGPLPVRYRFHAEGGQTTSSCPPLHSQRALPPFRDCSPRSILPLPSFPPNLA